MRVGVVCVVSVRVGVGVSVCVVSVCMWNDLFRLFVY